jgi:hypothetical protein
VPRASVLADFHARGNVLRYDLSLGLNALRPRNELADQTYVGVAQHLRWRELLLTQTVQLDREADGGWLLSAAQLGATVPLARGLVARTSVSRFRPAALGGLSPLPTFQRDRGSAGLGYYSGRISLNADVTATRRADGRTTTGYSASLFLPRTPAGLGISASASVSSSELFRSSYFSTDVSRRIGPVHARLGLRGTRFQGLAAAERNTGADLTFSLPLATRTQLLVRSGTWWGDAAGHRQRLFTSVTTGL